MLARVLEGEPDWRLPPVMPGDPTLLACLEKDRKRRLRIAAAARLEIDDALMSPAPMRRLTRRLRRASRSGAKPCCAAVASSSGSPPAMARGR